jgi:hypothetical protein
VPNINAAVFSEEKYPPFFKDEPVQSCAKYVANVLAKDTNYTGSDLINEAKSIIGLFQS